MVLSQTAVQMVLIYLGVIHLILAAMLPQTRYLWIFLAVCWFILGLSARLAGG